MPENTYYKTKHAIGDRERAILAEPRVAMVATTCPNGAPHVVPCWYLFDEDRFYTTVLSTSRRARNIAALGQARVLVEHRMGWISALGTARLLSGDGMPELHTRVAARYLTEEGRKHFIAASGVPDDAAIEIVVERWTAYSMIGGFRSIQEAGWSAEQIASWFVPLAGA